MDYSKIYQNLIDRARNRQLDCYCESHHILPRCMGGDDSPQNLVDLTPEEHYVAHQLLIRIYPNKPKLVYAAALMGSSRPTNKLYGWLRRRWIDTAREFGGFHTEKWHEAMARRRGFQHSEETKNKIRAAQVGAKRKLLSPQHREKLRLAALKRKREGRYQKFSEEARRNLSNAMKKARARSVQNFRMNSKQQIRS